MYSVFVFGLGARDSLFQVKVLYKNIEKTARDNSHTRDFSFKKRGLAKLGLKRSL